MHGIQSSVSTPHLAAVSMDRLLSCLLAAAAAAAACIDRVLGRAELSGEVTHAAAALAS